MIDPSWEEDGTAFASLEAMAGGQTALHVSGDAYGRGYRSDELSVVVSPCRSE
jgi:hypothetical protein